MSNFCQIAFVYEDQVASVEFDKSIPSPFTALQQIVISKLDFGSSVHTHSLYFLYEDDEGDQVTLQCDEDLMEAFSVREDSGFADLLLTVKTPEEVTMSEDSESDGDATERKEPTVPVLNEQFIVDLVSALENRDIRQVIPEISSEIAAAVLRRSPSNDIFYSLTQKFPVLNEAKLFTTEWPFISSWTSSLDGWLGNLTDDQLGKLSFQIPIIIHRLVEKRQKLFKTLFIKKKSPENILKIKQYEFGQVDLSMLYSQFAKVHSSSAKPSSHLGTACAVCNVNPIDGIRYKCVVCPAYDLCAVCEAKSTHPADHALMKMRTPAAAAFSIAPWCMTGSKKFRKVQSKSLKKELKMERKVHKHGQFTAHHRHHHLHHHPPPPHPHPHRPHRHPSLDRFAEMEDPHGPHVSPAPHTFSRYGHAHPYPREKRLY